MKNVDLKKGMHVCIAHSQTVSAYLHGAPAIVDELNVGKDFNGEPLHRVTLTEERRATGTASPLSVLHCRADQLEG